MAKHRFFADRPVKFSVTITGDDAHHIRDVIRLRIGDPIEVVDQDGNVSDVELVRIDQDRIIGKVVGRHVSDTVVPEVHLFQSLPKGGKLDGIIRMTTEIGVYSIHPIITERSIAKVDSEKIDKKQERWQKIALEASKQSHRTIVPEVGNVISWNKALQEIRNFDQVILFWEEETRVLPDEVLDPAVGKIAVVIGPEGGLSEKEVEDIKKIGAQVVTMGENILRVETAAPVAVAITIHELRRIESGE